MRLSPLTPPPGLGCCLGGWRHSSSLELALWSSSFQDLGGSRVQVASKLSCLLYLSDLGSGFPSSWKSCA